ncbi:FAD-dependent oxidoreductase [Frigidibacter sp. ROC022]|uniref:FAD-dependent oxidoreductase n=1 Tax=Frigidibacter sp. ROC022 TaxID=2971796 RepID=UPI00215A50FE|nr:FAD-dependent oxidoreductase [Frigidibacter sp. ROC022]MCR8725953.1 FAD-dependent oxidoreductase [Frigidibacter sp. ROC022]
MRIAVVGNGPVGAAAARHLSASGQQVVLIGPPEGAGYFASHHDQGRLVRALDHSPFWCRIKTASIARFRQIESASGIRFFHETGGMMAGSRDGALMGEADRVRQDMQVPVEVLDSAALAERFPFFRFPKDFTGYHEATGAGWLNPRDLVRAEIAIARAQGAELLPDAATALRQGAGGVEIETRSGSLTVDHALLAAGAWSRSLIDEPLPVSVYARTVMFLRVSPDEAARLAGMPTLVMQDAMQREPYLMPPIRYPDGGLWLKIGGDPRDLPLAREELDDWFRSPGLAEVAAHLEALLGNLMPDLRIEATRTEACAVSFAPGDRPLIDRLSDRLTVATAGCARGAKSGDELGRLAAEAVLGRVDPECRQNAGRRA